MLSDVLKSRLVDLLVREVSIVDRAANQRRFLLLKHEGGEPMIDEVKALEAIDAIDKAGLGDAVALLAEKDPESLSEWLDKAKDLTEAQKKRVQAALRILGPELAKSFPALFAAVKKDDGGKKKDPDGKGGDGKKKKEPTAPEGIQKRADGSWDLRDIPEEQRGTVGAVLKQLEADAAGATARADVMEDRAKKQEERITKMETDKRRSSFITKAAVLSDLPVGADDLGGDLMAINDKCGKEVFDRIVKLLEASNALVTKGVAFMRLSGEIVPAEAGDDGSKRAEFEKLIKEEQEKVRKASGGKVTLGYADAVAEVAKQNADLYYAYRKEITGGEGE